MISEEVLSRLLSDPEHAENYARLYELWKEARSGLDFVAADEKQFDEWDLRVQSLLDPAEHEFYLNPYDGLGIRRHRAELRLRPHVGVRCEKNAV